MYAPAAVNRIEWWPPPKAPAVIHVTVFPLPGLSDVMHIIRPAKPGLPRMQPIAVDEARTAAPAKIDKAEATVYGCATDAIFTGN
jgi:hypothetical protein